MVSYLEYCLNLLGDDATDMSDKDIVINQSYKKIFRDAQVQVEDDLDPGRKQPVNKSVQAYLKDVDFFFKKAEFKLEVQDISWSLNAQNQVYYKVTLLRKLSGTDILGNDVQNTRQRFIEINLDEQKQDLKIASYYTTKVTEIQDLFTWWDQLPVEWKKHFGREIPVDDDLLLSEVVSLLPDASITDSVRIRNKRLRLNNQRTINGLKRLVNTEKLDLSGQNFFTDLSPLSKFSGLKELNLTHTLASSLDGLRACSALEKLIISHTAVKSLEPLKYLPSLKELDCTSSLVSDVSPLVYLSGLEQLSLANTFVTDITPLSSVGTLKELSLYNLRINDLSALSGLAEMQILDISKTDVYQLDALRPLQNLQKLNIENTTVQNIDPLLELPALQLVYADGSRLTREQVKLFMEKKPECQVIYESGELSMWWNSLSNEWKSVFANYTNGASTLTKEQLHELIRIREMDISFLPVKDLTGLRYLTGMKKLTARQLQLNSLKGLERLAELEHLDLTGTRVDDYSYLRSLAALNVLILNETGFNRLNWLDSLKYLQRIEIEETPVTAGEAEKFEARHPGVTLIYRSKELRKWWNELSSAWKDHFVQTILFAEPTDEDLHLLVRKESITVTDNPAITDLSALRMFTHLKELSVSGTAVSDFSPATGFTQLEKLHMPKNPVTDFSFLYNMIRLKELNLSSLRISDIDFLENLYGLEYLNLSNVSIKSIAPLKALPYLRYVDISNTKVKSLAPLKNASMLGNLICYNTQIKEKAVEKFRKWRPGCNVIYY